MAGQIPSPGRAPQARSRKRNDDSWLMDTTHDRESIEQALAEFKFRDDANAAHPTSGVSVVKTLGKVPKEFQPLQTPGCLFDVLDMNGHWVDRMMLLPAKTSTGVKV